MEETNNIKETSNISLEQKIFSAGADYLIGLGTLWLAYDIPDIFIGAEHPYETLKGAIFNIGVPTLAYLSATYLLYLTNVFSDIDNQL